MIVYLPYMTLTHSNKECGIDTVDEGYRSDCQVFGGIKGRKRPLLKRLPIANILIATTQLVSKFDAYVYWWTGLV